MENDQNINNNGKDSVKELSIIVTMKIVNGVYQPVGIKNDSTALSNEMASIFMLEKAKDLVKMIHQPRIVKPQNKGGIMNFARKRR